MARKKKTATEPGTSDPTTKGDGKTAEDAAHRKPRHDSIRETVEQIVIAFALAFIFRTFVTEAFVIPTGSMAPTLMGRHKDIDCQECGYHFQIGASDEVTDDGFLIDRIETAICPNCRYESEVREELAFTGDRILVNKFSYEFGRPDRWDVVVFKYPEEPKTNYIKRCVGLPGETLRVARGDVYARKGDGEEFRILRKQNPDKQLELQQIVYDDRSPSLTLRNAGWPNRWQAVREAEPDEPAGPTPWKAQENSWTLDPGTQTYQVTADAQTHWLRYFHYVPDESDWAVVLSGGKPPEPKPKLITDFCYYNAYTGGRGDGYETDLFWVGDLTVSCKVRIDEVADADAELQLELVEGVRRYRCRIDLGTGEATLTQIDDLLDPQHGEETQLASAATNVRGPGKHFLVFSNVDDRLALWVDGWHIAFDGNGEYAAPLSPNPQRADLAPVGVSLRNATADVSDLIVQRDIYYRAERVGDGNEQWADGRPQVEYDGSHDRLRQLLEDPSAWAHAYAERSHAVTFAALSDDEYFVLGDNSPRSKDSRLWSNVRQAEHRHAVPAEALVGQAFFVFWPHGIPFLNNGKGFGVKNHAVHPQARVDTYPSIALPFYPQWWRMQRIR